MVADLLYNIFHHFLMSINYRINFDLYGHQIIADFFEILFF